MSLKKTMNWNRHNTATDKKTTTTDLYTINVQAYCTINYCIIINSLHIFIYIIYKYFILKNPTIIRSDKKYLNALTENKLFVQAYRQEISSRLPTRNSFVPTDKKYVYWHTRFIILYNKKLTRNNISRL